MPETNIYKSEYYVDDFEENKLDQINIKEENESCEDEIGDKVNMPIHKRNDSEDKFSPTKLDKNKVKGSRK